jgi:UPF0755 protein
MNNQRRRPVFLLLITVIFLVGCVGLIVGYLFISSEVATQFGQPSPNLSLTQRVIYPLELFINREKMTSPTNFAGDEQTFIIEQGESVSMVCIRLEQAGLIEDAELFRIYLVYSGLDRHLQSGRFTINPSMSPLQITADLLDATPKDAIVSILPGWRIEEIAVNVAGSGLAIDKESFITAAYNPPPAFFTTLPITEAPSLEGFLYPGIYVIPREAELETVFETILSEFTVNVDETLLEGFKRQDLSLYEAVTLASIIEKEAILDEEKPMIASVFFNRLAAGIRLETDPTVQYALGYQEETQSWWKSPLSGSDLGVESPYNTYSILSLPPTPICNPDLSSLRAVAFPAETPYYYFRAACDGSGRHNFAITYEEHLSNGCE